MAENDNKKTGGREVTTPQTPVMVTMTQDQLDQLISAVSAKNAAQGAPASDNGRVVINQRELTLRDQLYTTPTNKLLPAPKAYFAYNVGKFVSAYKDMDGRWVLPPDNSFGFVFRPSHDVKQGENHWMPVCKFVTQDADIAAFIENSPEFGFRIVTSITSGQLTAAAMLQSEDIAIFNKYRGLDQQACLARVKNYNESDPEANLPVTGNLEALRQNLAAYEAQLSRKRRAAAVKAHFDEGEKIHAMGLRGSESIPAGAV